MIKTAAASFGGTLVIVLGLVTLLQSAGAAAVSDLKTRHDQQLLGSSECSFGPSYWCQSMSNAVSCNAVSHCMQTAWITLADSEVGVGADLCSVCKRGIDKLEREIQNHHDTRHLAHALNLMCDLLLSKIPRTACKAAIEVVLPMIEHAATQPVDAEHACVKLTLCKSSSLDDGERATENEKENVNVEEDAVVAYSLDSSQESVQPSLDGQNDVPEKDLDHSSV